MWRVISSSIEDFIMKNKYFLIKKCTCDVSLESKKIPIKKLELHSILINNLQSRVYRNLEKIKSKKKEK